MNCFAESPEESDDLAVSDSADDLTEEVANEPVEVDAPAAVEEPGEELDFDADPGLDSDSDLDELPGDAADEIDDIFSQKLPKGMRVWTDDTGQHKTIGRLVVIARSKIRLLKTNGRYATVPLKRLSNEDVQYVMVVAKRIADSKQVASL